MLELDFEIARQENRKYDLHTAIGKPFEYGRNPSDDEYLSISKAVSELEKVEYALEVLRDIKRDITSNKDLP